MSTYQSVLEQALELTDEERELLVRSVAMTLDEGLADVDEAVWGPEIARRLAAIRSGDDELVAWEQAEALIFDDSPE